MDGHAVEEGLGLRRWTPARDTAPHAAPLSPAGGPVNRGAGAADPILLATGVAAADILRRCADRRGGTQHPAGLARAPARSCWRLGDFSPLPDAEFIDAAHRALLGRAPYARETVRRCAELRGGRSRSQVLLRLALSPEGRRAGPKPVAGLVLPALVATAGMLERLLRTPGARVAARALWRAGQITCRRCAVAAGRLWRAACAMPVLGALIEGLALLPRLGQMRRDIVVLHREQQELRQQISLLRHERNA